MAVTVKYFASLREHHGSDRQLDAPGDGATVADIWARAGGGETLPENVLMAVNLESFDRVREQVAAAIDTANGG